MSEADNNLHIITVHGTFAGRDYLDARKADQEFYAEASNFAADLKRGLNIKNWHEYTWSGNNLESDRQKAGKKFWKFLKSEKFAPTDKLVILAHSHGGNVALEGLRKRPIDNDVWLYTFGTPFIHKQSPGGALCTIGKLELYIPVSHLHYRRTDRPWARALHFIWRTVSGSERQPKAERSGGAV